MDVLITGAAGFVGSSLVKRLSLSSHLVVRSSVRTGYCDSSTGNVFIGELNAEQDWSMALKGVDVVIHAAARVHVMNETTVDPIESFRAVNVVGTLNLARQAVLAGVKRFIFISSVKVNGEQTEDGFPFTPDDVPAPSSPYAISKMEAEYALQDLAKESGLEVVIIRTPLVYGPDVKANFRTMLTCIERGIPLPLGAIYNTRSLVSVDNLIDLITVCVEHPAAANQIFIAGDGEDLSTSELLRRLAQALEKPCRLFSVPIKVLELGAIMIGKRSLYQKLCGSLQVDISKAQIVLDWTPPISVDDGLRRTAERDV